MIRWTCKVGRKIRIIGDLAVVLTVIDMLGGTPFIKTRFTSLKRAIETPDGDVAVFEEEERELRMDEMREHHIVMKLTKGRAPFAK